MKHRIISIAILIILLTFSRSYASSAPGIGLYMFSGETHITHSASDPLLLYVIIDNSMAMFIERQNRRSEDILQKYKETDHYADLSKIDQAEVTKQYQAKKLPNITLGSSKVSLESLIGFVAKDQQGNILDIKVRALQSNDHQPRAISLLQERSLLYRFVIESDQFEKFQSDIFYLVANVDTGTNVDMWQGQVDSSAATVKLGQPETAWEGSTRRLLLIGTYLLSDNKFSQAELHAMEWLQKHPNSVDGWAQLAEAYYGQGLFDEALEAFDTAVDRFREKHGSNPQELPMELIDRIREIQGSRS